MLKLLLSPNAIPSHTLLRHGYSTAAAAAVHMNSPPPITNASHVTKPPVISKTLLADIPARWTTMPASERDVVLDSLLVAQKGDWKNMSLEQKRALFFIAYGPYGPRERLPKGFQIQVFGGTVGVLVAASALFYWIRQKGGPGVHTTTKEWQEAANEYSRSQGANPYTGISSDNYKGSGHVAEVFKK